MIFGNQLRVFMVASVVIAIVYLGRPLNLWRAPKPQIAQQVPSSWRDVWPPRTASFLYAGALGLTFFTRVSSLALFPLTVLAMGLGKWPFAIICLFAITGLLRAATALIVPLFDWVDQGGRTISQSLGAAGRIAVRLEGVLLAGAAAALLTTATIAWI